ncbi:hypothetical protein FH972_027037 [Carpinus fangiana]|uniref:Uncharacterized protein n=1 Tax=Carpinus fangiana TaxID=176857 RepID=A0A5N6L880_9ROSI|nr:hypothetical protein FH972_027037 [Carpinus fangiana]
MVNTRSRSRIQPNNQTRPPPTPQTTGDREHIASLEVQVAQLIQQNEELRQRRPKSSHSEEQENQHQPTGVWDHEEEGRSR